MAKKVEGYKKPGVKRREKKEEGDTIVVVAGAWKDTVGAVQRIDYNKQTATINVELFGRETPVEIGFEEVRRFN